MPRLRTLILVIAAALLAPVAFAQTTHSIAVYGIASQITGTAGLGELEVDVDVDVDTIFENLEMAGMARYRAERSNWSFVAEGVFLGLGASNAGVAMDIDLTIFEVGAGYRLSESIEAYAGLRYTDLSVALEDERPFAGTILLENGDEFLDPIVGLRFKTPISANWLLQAQGDLGGFGIDMDFQWRAMVNLGYQANESWSLWFGYQALDQDFEDAGNNGRFSMDVTYHGPQAAVAYTF